MSSLCNPSPSSPSLPQNLPLREIPGNYGFPFFGPLKDRWDFFYFQGRDNFFRSRIENHNSTVFRTNMVPGPWISHDPRVVVLLDAKSFPVLFDMSKVEKNDVLTGTYTPSTSFTGGYRVCAYLDPRETLHHQLADEIRTVVKSEGGVTLNAIHKMTLTKSVVYEAFRIEPPIPYQYGRAKENLMIQSHDYSFKVNKGEMLFGYQPFATKDPKIFDEPEKFKGNRFVGEEGEKLLKYVLWCNGRVIDDPTVENKQCPGKNLVELMSTVFLVELFLRYDSFSIDANNSNNCVCLSLKKGESLEYDV
ncbi:allene oxide synthase-like isoform X2 [Amaranthus tricolor]|uniref:allene oxide synthase-like isoform X2 n=1 Tax=Amaranthus tricolor TaxID=29722 RepID=UPI002589F0B6|nr:allene oxide synthase-like isoform X2 [Amaranthus tricolor]